MEQVLHSPSWPYLKCLAIVWQHYNFNRSHHADDNDKILNCFYGIFNLENMMHDSHPIYQHNISYNGYVSYVYIHYRWIPNICLENLLPNVIMVSSLGILYSTGTTEEPTFYRPYNRTKSGKYVFKFGTYIC